jgi:sugar phosphate isomerase/epimerase
MTSPSGSGRDKGLDDIGWVLWSGTIGLESPMEARVAAAQAAGFTRVTVGPHDVARAEEQGTKPDDLGRYLHDAGLDIVMDPVMNWYGDPSGGTKFTPFSLDEVLSISETWGVVSINVLGPMHDMPLQELVGPFGRICDRAADLGAQVFLEFMPMLGVKDLAGAWAIVQGAERPNGGILFDTWHFFRSNPDFALLETVPGDRIFAVQIADGPTEVQTSVEEETFNRRLPGDGSLDLDRVVRTLDRIGGLRWVGPEVISPLTQAMDPADAARLAGDRVRELIARVRGEGRGDGPAAAPAV